MNDSSFGSGAPKNRSINVGANLLGEWIADRETRRQESMRYVAVLAATLLVAAVSLPSLWRASSAQTREAHALQSRVAALDEQLALLDKANKAAHPGIVVKAMRGRTTASFEHLLARVGRVLGAGNSRMALASLHCDVAAGEAHIVVQADAQEDGAADAFAKAAGEAAAKVDGIVTSHPSHLLGDQGIAFQYEKRIGVDK